MNRDGLIAFALGSFLLLSGCTGDRAKGQSEAEKAAREAIRLKPGGAEAHTNLGAVLSTQGKFEQAEKECREAIRLKPDFAEAHYNLGAVLGEQGKDEEAEKEYREAIRLKPDYTVALENVAVLLDKLGRRKEAREFWEMAGKAEARPAWVDRIKKRLAELD